MIRINKSNNSPNILSTRGQVAKGQLCAAYDANPPGYQNGNLSMSIDSNIYGASEVKEQLKAEQHEKCCFCEAKFVSNGYGDVEHYRPKKGYKNKVKDKLVKPGYYWKAYDWDNLFFSCQICNQNYKKNLFPLVNENNRASNHHDSLEPITDTLLVHPSEENPQDHIGFRRHVPFPKTDKGKISIKAYGIDREKLNEKRLDHLIEVEKNATLSSFDPQLVTQENAERVSLVFGKPITVEELRDLIKSAKEFIAVAAHREAEFTGMVRENFPGLSRE